MKEGEMCSVAEVKRMSDIIMSLKLDIKGMVLNVVSVFAPLVAFQKRKRNAGVSLMEW